MDMAAPISKSTARDMVKGILEDMEEIPTMDGAKRIAEEYLERGVFIEPEYLLDVWLDTKNRPGAKRAAGEWDENGSLNHGDQGFLKD